jgi:hypothetical protein
MIARFRRRLSKGQHRISLILIMDQDQQRVGRQRYIRREAFRSNLFGREILPTDEKLHAALFSSPQSLSGLDCSCQTSLQSRFGTQPQSARRSQRHAGQLQNIGDSLTTRVRRARPSQHFKTQLLQVFTTVFHVWRRRNK